MTNPTKVKLMNIQDLEEKKPARALVANVDLVVIKDQEAVHVLYGRCLHRGALLSDGCVKGGNIICGVHNWDFKYETGVSEYNNKEVLPKFKSWVENGAVFVDLLEIENWEKKNPQAYNRKAYLGDYADLHGTADEPATKAIQQLAKNGLTKTGHHGPMGAMGVPGPLLPLWDEIQIQTAQLATQPIMENVTVNTKVVIGPYAKKPLELAIPIFVSDMSYGALSEEAKIALAKGAQQANTGICSGEGGVLPEEHANNSRYFYELASAMFGYNEEIVSKVQAFHFKGGQGAKTGTGGHLPGDKVRGKIAEVRHLKEGQDAISPPTFANLHTPKDFKDFSDRIRALTGGIPIGFKLSANHIEANIDFAIDAGADYIILDGRGGGTGAAPLIFRDNISVPTIPALAKARRHLDKKKSNMTLVITGGLRTPADFIKALCLGADAIAISNSALQAIGCLGMRACHSNNCPVGIATQKPHLRARLDIQKSADQLQRFFESSVEIMEVMARACGHNDLGKFNTNDLVTWKKEMHHLTGISYAGVTL